MPRLFVAIWPPAHVCDHVRALPRHGWSDVRWTPEQNWHVTLRFLGDADADDVADALAAVELPGGMAHVSSELVTLGSHSVVVPVSGVDALAGVVRQATGALGSHPPNERFRGHLTVGRAIGRRKIVRDGSGSGARATGVASFDVTEIALVESTLSPAGAGYATVATFRVVTGGGR
jgi:2'-5' RNA ligase